MPIYEYRCEQCRCDFEYLKLSESDPDPECPSCCGKDIKKLISAGSFRPEGVPSGSGGFSGGGPKCRPSGG